MCATVETALSACYDPGRFASAFAEANFYLQGSDLNVRATGHLNMCQCVRRVQTPEFSWEPMRFFHNIPRVRPRANSRDAQQLYFTTNSHFPDSSCLSRSIFEQNAWVRERQQHFFQLQSRPETTTHGSSQCFLAYDSAVSHVQSRKQTCGLINTAGPLWWFPPRSQPMHSNAVEKKLNSCAAD